MTKMGTVAGAVVACLFLIGCGGGEGAKGKITGQATVGDKPVTAGEIKLHGSNNIMLAAPIQGDGSFTFTDAPVGEVKFSVHPPAAMLGGGGASPKGVTPVDSGSTSGGVPPNPSKSPPIPIRYQNAESTDLKMTVKAGDNSFEAKMAK